MPVIAANSNNDSNDESKGAKPKNAKSLVTLKMKPKNKAKPKPKAKPQPKPKVKPQPKSKTVRKQVIFANCQFSD